MLSSHSPVMYSSEFDEFLRPSTPDHDDPLHGGGGGRALNFDFHSSNEASTSSHHAPPSSSNFFNFSASPPTGSSSSQSYSPPSSTTSGLPTEDEIFGMMNGVCAEGGNESGGGGAFGGMADVFSFGDGLGGQGNGLMSMGGGGGGGGGSSSSSAHVHGLDLSRPPSTEFLDLDPFFQFGNTNNNRPINNQNQNQNFLPQQQQQQQQNHLGFATNADASHNNNNPAPIPSFLLSHINNASLFTPEPLFSSAHHPSSSSHPPSLTHSHSGTSQSHSHPSSSASSIHSLASLAPPSTQQSSASATSTTTTKRKLSSSASPFVVEQPKQSAPASANVAISQNGKVSDHNAIERKYRDHISDGFTRLRDSVPVLRVLFGTSTPTTLPLDTPSPLTGLIDGMPKETKQGKATVLGAAREYIWMLQRERAKLSRSIEFLEARMSENEKQAWRNAFESSEQTVQLDPYLTSITYPYASSDSASPSSSSAATSPNSEPTKPPPRKRAKPTASSAAKSRKSSKAELVSDGGKVLLGVVASVSLFGGAERLGLASEASGVPVAMSEGTGGGRVMGMTRRAVGGVASRAEGWSWGWKLWLGVVVCLLVLPALRRLMLRMFRSRDEERMQRLEEAVGKEEVEVEELRRELGAPKGVRALMRGVLGEWCKGLVGKGLRMRGGGGGKMVELERRGWERVAEKQMSLPTDLKSYLTSLYTYLRLANLSTSSSTSSPRTLSLLSLLSISLAGGDITPAASALWSSARAALPSSPSRPQDRAMAEVLELTLSDVLAISPEAFSSNVSPLEVIASSLTLRDILHVWQTLFSSFAPPATQPSSSFIPPTNLVTLPAILADRSRKALISSEIASLVASTTPGSEAHELALVCMGGWSLLVREEEGVKWSLGRLVGQGIQRSLGAGGKALLAVGGVESSSSSSQSAEEFLDHNDEGEDIDLTPTTSSSFTTSITQQINTISSFLITYQALVLSLPSLTNKTNNNNVKSKSFPTLLPQTLHLRALLNSPDLENGSAVDEEAKERFVDGLYGLGRWSVGWRDVGDEDSGFSE